MDVDLIGYVAGIVAAVISGLAAIATWLFA